MKCDVYLTFDGNCEEAMLHYQDVFDGEINLMMRYSDGPPEYNSPDIENKIMHTTMTFGTSCELKASDNMGGAVNKGNGYHVSILADDVDQGHAFFNGLAEGGQITMPFDNVFWGGKFGSVIDKFGVQWMVSTPHGENA